MTLGWKATNWWRLQRYRFPILIELVIWLLAITLATISASMFRFEILSLFRSDDAYQTMQSLLLGVGSALMGATAVVASFLLFSLQINVDRLPHGMFRRLNSDRSLLLAFGVALVVAFVVASLSLSANSKLAPWMVVALIFGTILILRLLFFSYQRTLRLISPVHQLNILFGHAAKEFEVWDRRARWFAPLQNHKQKNDAEEDIDQQIDIKRVEFFLTYPQWTNTAHSLLRDLESFAAWSGQKMDSEAHAASLGAIIQINRAYITTKGRTFFPSNPLIEIPEAHDALISETLDCLSRIAEACVQRSDETGLERIFKSFVALHEMYTQLPYPGSGVHLSHANSASFYLEGLVEKALAQGLTNSTMNGIRSLSSCSKTMIKLENAQDAHAIVERIGVLGVIAAPSVMPITRTAMEQMSDLTITLINSRNHDIGFMARTIRENVKAIALGVLQREGSPSAQNHSFPLAPYFSADSKALRKQFADCIKTAMAAADKNDDVAQWCFNLAAWSDGLSPEIREILQETITQRSNFRVDLLFWIGGVTETFLVAAQLPACSDHARSNLRGAAIRMISTLSWIPRDDETLRNLDLRLVPDTLFDVARKAKQLGEMETFTTCENLLFRWGFGAGEHVEGSDDFYRSMVGLAIMTLSHNDPALDDIFLERVRTELAKPIGVHPDVSAAAVANLLAAAGNIEHTARGFDRILAALISFHADRTSALLIGIAEVLNEANGN